MQTTRLCCPALLNTARMCSPWRPVKPSEAIAAVAWLPDVEKDAKEGERKRIVQYEVIPHLVREGWNLKGETLEAIWRGERDEKILLDGIDGGSALAVLAILKHTKNLERMYGPAPAQG